MPSHRVYSADPLRPGTLVITGEEAHHAVRVKRLAAGDRVQVLDGRGGLAQAQVTDTDRDRNGWRLHLDLGSIATMAPVRPAIEVLSPAPKGPRLADMIEGLSQVGAARWSPLDTEYTQADAPRADRLERIASEASKQCGRPWLLHIGEPVLFSAAIAAGPVILADASGGPYRRCGAPSIRLLIGPEGGWSPRELQAARDAGITTARFGPHIMRIETAAVVAAAVVLATEGE